MNFTYIHTTSACFMATIPQAMNFPLIILCDVLSLNLSSLLYIPPRCSESESEFQALRVPGRPAEFNHSDNFGPRMVG